MRKYFFDSNVCNLYQFNSRAPRIEQLQSDIEQFAEALAAEQKLQNSIRSETYEYVCQLQQSASMLAIPDTERAYESSCNARSGDDESSYGQRNERVSCVFSSLHHETFLRFSHHSTIHLLQQLV